LALRATGVEAAQADTYGTRERHHRFAKASLVCVTFFLAIQTSPLIRASSTLQDIPTTRKEKSSGQKNLVDSFKQVAVKFFVWSRSVLSWEKVEEEKKTRER
jgi:hypothetical protein